MCAFQPQNCCSVLNRIFRKLDRYFQGQWQLAVLADTNGLWTVPWHHLSFLKAQNAMGRHILIQPTAPVEPWYMMVDDLSPMILRQHHQRSDGAWKPGRLIVETSPNNYQCWIHSDRNLTLNDKQYWLKRMRNDPGAHPLHRWGRCPGFFNKKDTYRSASDTYPLARLVWIDWKHMARIPEIPVDSMSHNPCTATPHATLTPATNRITRNDYDHGNESVTDFSYALALARRQFTKEQIMHRLLNERHNWSNHTGESRQMKYLDRTVSKAIHIVRTTKRV